MGPKPPSSRPPSERGLRSVPGRPLPLETLDSDDHIDVVEVSRGPLAPPLSSGVDADALGEFEAIFQYAPVAMVLVDRHRVVCRMNRAAFALAGVSTAEPAGQLPGVMLCCAHYDEAGCGLGPRCPDCDLRQLIEACFADQVGAQQVEASAPYSQGGQVQERRFRISSSFLRIREQARALLCLEDITDARALQQHGNSALELERPR